jgi:hypothetical protein
MNLREFHNFLRILLNIDADEFMQAVYGRDTHPGEGGEEWAAWTTFREDPYRWFIKAGDQQAAALWKIIERRNLQSVHRKVSDCEPLVLYFSTPEDRAGFIEAVKEAKPGMISEAVEL